MNSKTRLIVALTIAMLMPACTLEHEAAQTSICKTAQANGWRISSDWPTDASLDSGGFTFFFNVRDTGSKNDIVGPVRPAYWIEVSGLTLGAAVVSQRRPMLYDPSEAIVVLNGRSVRALPRIWISEQVDGFFLPTGEVSVPVDLNVDDARGVKENFYVAFPIAAPEAKDIYEFQPGTALLDGKRVALPTFASCFFPSRTWWQPIH